MKISKLKRYNKHTTKSLRYKNGGSQSSHNCIYDATTGKMKNECPGKKYFEEIKDTLVKDPDAVYMLYGHGCDLENEIKIIPKNCKFITSVACGIARDSRIIDDIMTDFLQNTIVKPINIDTLNKYERVSVGKDADPITKKWLTRNEEYRIHNEGEYFVNNKNWCFLQLGFLSGLRKLGHIIPSIPNLNDDTPQKYTLRSYLLMHFEGSLFPTCHQVNKCLDNTFSKKDLDSYNYSSFSVNDEFIVINDTITDMIRTNFSIDFATLVYNLEGTFINAACRPICKGNKTAEDIEGLNDEFVAVSRNMSGRETYSFDDKFYGQLQMNENSEIVLTHETKRKLQQL